jgi:hypothetical protein
MARALGAVLIGTGLLVAIFAPRISRWERRMTAVRPWTRVTGWSGTTKGIVIWRLLGLVIITYGIVLIATDW